MNVSILNDQAPDWVINLPPEFHRHYFGVQVWQWLGLLILVVVSRLAMVGGNRIAVRVMRTRDRFFPGEISAETQRATRRAAGLLAGTLVFYALAGWLDLPPKMDHALAMVVESGTILAFALLTYAIWDTICDSMVSRAAGVSKRAERLLVPLTRKFVRALILVVAFFIALSTVFNVNVAAVIASVGLGGIVVALAAKDSVENIIGSVTLLFDMPFAIGDWVKIDKIEGIVEEINLRSTRIRTFEDTTINLPNANLIRAAVENVSARRYRRQKINLRVSYDTPPEKLNALCSDLRTYLENEELVDSSRVIVNLSDVDDVAMTVLVQCHFDAETQTAELELRHKVLAEITRLRIKNGVLFYPVGIGRLPAG